MKKFSKFISIILICTMMMLCISGCGNQNDTGMQENNQQSSGDYSPVTIENYGREITIDKMPEKIVTAGPNCTEVMIELGLGDKVVGKSCDNHSRGPLEELAGEYEKIPELTYGYPNLEAVVGSGCDFIYAIDWVFEGDFTVEALEQYGITVYVCDATDYDGVWQQITDLGKIFAVEDKAQSYIESEKSRLTAVESAVSGEDIQKVFVYDSDTGSGVYTAGGPNIESLFIETAGGENIFKELDKAWVGVSYEEILAREPDAIIVHDYEEATYEENVEKLKADPILSQLKCVQEEKFIKLSLESALPGSRTAYSVESIAKGLYPEKFE